jgi:hypothetical protein
MVAALVLAAALAVGPAGHHVRTSDRQIQHLFDRGLAQSPTLRRLVAMLDASDVIVYLEPKRSRQALGGYLSHHIVTTGSIRYLRVLVETTGTPRVLVSLMAHELQHAVEVAEVPDARDADDLDRLFRGLAAPSGCEATDCYETDAAKQVERTVNEEMSSRHRVRTLAIDGTGKVD